MKFDVTLTPKHVNELKYEKHTRLTKARQWA